MRGTSTGRDAAIHKWVSARRRAGTLGPSDCPLLKEAGMYIGLGTVLVILLILLVIGVLR